MISIFFFLLTQLAFISASTSQPLYQDPTQVASYVGTWIGITASGTFKVTMKEKKNFSLPTPEGRKMHDAIVGRHSYVVSNSNKKNESFLKPEDEYGFFGVPSLSKNGIMKILFKDDVNNKSIIMDLSFVPGSTKEIHWKLAEVLEGTNTNRFDNPNAHSLPGVSVPTDIILRKVN